MRFPINSILHALQNQAEGMQSRTLKMPKRIFYTDIKAPFKARSVFPDM